MGASRYVQARDGLPARVSGPWAKEKLETLAAYFKIVNTAMRGKWRTICLDLLAGCGRCVLDSNGEEFDGSPLRAIVRDPPFDPIVLVEEDSKLVRALQKRVEETGKPATILVGDCNNAAVIAQVRRAIPSSSLSIAFLDNLGLDVQFETVRRLVDERRMDLVVTFQVSDMARNVDLACADVRLGDRWDRYFGTPTWRDAVIAFKLKRSAAPDVGSALADFYADQLATLGYSHRQQLNLNDEEHQTSTAVSVDAVLATSVGREVVRRYLSEHPCPALVEVLNTGRSVQRRPPRTALSPPRFDGCPPSCFRKNLTCARSHWSRVSSNHDSAAGRAPRLAFTSNSH